MATILMTQETRGAGYNAAISAPATAATRASQPQEETNATSALSEVALAALADVRPSSESDSSQDSAVRRRMHHRAGQMPLAPGSSSNGSEGGGSQTDDTSPKSALSRVVGNTAGGEVLGVARPQRPYTPEQQRVGGLGIQESPPLKQGAKRTASGAVKTMGIVEQPIGVIPSYPTRGHVRAKSSSRAVEISSALKARLAYAMVKVNNGWENQSLDQLEHISRMSSPTITSPMATSPQRRRFSMNSEYNDRYITSPDMQQSPQQFSTRTAYQQGHMQYSPPVMASNAPTFGHTNGAPSLAPAAPIAPGRSHRRSLSTKAPPHLTTAYGYNGAGQEYHNQPTTPRRQGILRMPSQQAEKDALDSLLFMASPNNSANLKYTDSPAGPSPLRTEFPAAVKRVVFES